MAPTMLRITPDRAWPLHDIAATRRLEEAAATGLPPHTLMQRAGRAVARLALAIAPHARAIWVACGPGNNGGDGLEAALHLHQCGKPVTVTWLGEAARLPADARASLERARAAGVPFAPRPPDHWDLAIDALLGIGSFRPPEGLMMECLQRLRRPAAPVLAVDVPTGLDADRGAYLAVRATHTLSLLTLKPGLFTAQGRDACGELWFDDLGVDAAAEAPLARLVAPPPRTVRPHASHKGSHGDVAIIGGAAGMTGAALLAGRAALHHGAGRVYVGLLDRDAPAIDPLQPDLMLRDPASLDLQDQAVACGCGGGDAAGALLPAVLEKSRALVLDADALNAIAANADLQDLLETRGRDGRPTVITPHPLEAARLLGTSSAAVQGNRLQAASQLASRYGVVTVLKGSGTVIATPGDVWINATGNARLAIAGTGDVLAGQIAARLAAGEEALQAACAAVYLHGLAAERWPGDEPLTAAALATR